MRAVVSITVNNTNTAPTAINLSGTSVAENQPAGTVVGESCWARRDWTTHSASGVSVALSAGSNASGSLRRLKLEGGSSTHPARLLIMNEAPSIDANEITDKGYINQRAVLSLRAAEVDALYEGGERVILPG